MGLWGKCCPKLQAVGPKTLQWSSSWKCRIELEGGVLDKAGKVLLGSPSMSRTSSGIFDYDREHANHPEPKVDIPAGHSSVSLASAHQRGV